MDEDEKIKEYTFSTSKANWYSFLAAVPFSVVTIILFIFIWNVESFHTGRKVFYHSFLYIFVFGIILHELLHGLTWLFFIKGNFKSIKFGLNGLTPYCHCKAPLKAKHYKLGGAMPLIIMGFLPLFAGFVAGNGFYLLLGIFFTITAGGDIISLLMLRKINNNQLVFDHPDKLGFFIVSE